MRQNLCYNQLKLHITTSQYFSKICFYLFDYKENIISHGYILLNFFYKQRKGDLKNKKKRQWRKIKKRQFKPLQDIIQDNWQQGHSSKLQINIVNWYPEHYNTLLIKAY